jgi:hypothetical protein
MSATHTEVDKPETIPGAFRFPLTTEQFIHPLVAVFMAVWFGMAGQLSSPEGSIVPWGMLMFGVVLTLAGFIPEALKAKRLISEAVLGSATRNQTAEILRGG